MTSSTLNKLLMQLGTLDPERDTKISFDRVNGCITLTQVGRVVQLTSMKGLIPCKSNSAILTVEDLHTLTENLRFLIMYPDDILISPIPYGFKVYVRDLKNPEGPRILFDLNLYSVKSKVLVLIAKMFNKKYRRLLKM